MCQLNKFCKILVVVILLILSSQKIVAQDTITAVYTDYKTYQDYMQKNGNDLLKIGKRAHKHGIDFYYLQKRMAIAYFETKNYCMATEYFNKILNDYPDNDVAREYLYFSYLYSGRYADAKLLADKSGYIFRKRLKIPQTQLLQSISLDAGIVANNDYVSQTNKFIGGSDSIYGEQSVLKTQQFFSAGAQLRINSKWSMYVAFSNLRVNNTQQIYQLKGLQNNFETGINQNEIYVSANNHFKYGWDLTMAAHLLIVNTQQNVLSYNSANFISHYDTSYLNNVTQQIVSTTVYDTIHGFYKYYQPVITNKTTTLNNFALSAAIAKSWRIFNFSLNGVYSSLNNLTQFQLGGGIAVYPFGNLNLFSLTNANFWLQQNVQRIILSQTIGFKFTQNVGCNIFYSIGDISNYTENNGYVVYNNIDMIKLRTGINGTFALFNSKLLLTLRYQFIQKESQLLTYQFQSFQNETLTETKVFANNGVQEIINSNYVAKIKYYVPLYSLFKYNNQSIIGGLTWFF